MKKIYKLIGCITCFLALIFILSYIVQPKNNDKESGMQQPTAYAFLSEKENTIDTFVVGDSLAYSSISAMKIWEDYGYTTYVGSTPSQPLYQSYDILKKAFQNQKPKMVILEGNAIYRKKDFYDYFSFEVEEKIPLLKYHNRWKSLTKEDFHSPVKYRWIHDLKGYRLYQGIKSAKYYDYMKEEEDSQKITKMNNYFLNKIHDLCKKNGSQFVIINAPSLKDWSYAKHKGVLEYANANNIEYIDMNLLNQQIQIDWLKDTRDKGEHLNHQGAIKVTEYLGKYLNQTGLFISHKEDKNYERWHESLVNYKKLLDKK